MTFQVDHTRLTTASPEAVWERWATADLWAPDDPDTVWASFDGPVETGATGRVKSVGSPAQRFRFSRVEPLRRMDLEIVLPGARLGILHRMEPRAEGLSVTHGILIEGPLSFAYALLVGRPLARGLPEVVRLVTTHALGL